MYGKKWLGFGPEELNVPKDFEFPVSSFGQYGGHASLHIRYDSQTASPFYTGGTSTTSSPGDNIAFLQGMCQQRMIMAMALLVFLFMLSQSNSWSSLLPNLSNGEKRR